MKATRSGNARIHGMTQVTSPFIVYIATQVWSSPEACQIYNHFFRHGLPSVPHLYSPGQIQSQIPNTFTRVYWLSLKMSMDKKRFKSFLSGGIWVIQSTFTLFSLLTPSSARFFQTTALACMHWQRTVCCQESRKSAPLLKQQQLSLHRTQSIGWSPCSLLTFGSVN